MKHAAKAVARFAAAVVTIAALLPIAAAETCAPSLPAGAMELLASVYPDYRVLRLADLNADDQTIWKNAYHDACPGVVKGAFTGKEGSYAVLLVPARSDDGETRAVLLLPKEGGGLTQTQIFTEHRVGNLPVIRRSDPGVYEDPGKRVKVTAPNDVVLVEHLESKVTAIAFVKGQLRLLTIAE
jgi:hypothetical protein